MVTTQGGASVSRSSSPGRRPPRIAAAVASGLGALCLAGAPLAAQRGTPFAGEAAVEHHLRERWLHGGQVPRFTPFAETRRWTLVDSVRAVGPTRRLYLTLARVATGRDSALLVADSAGAISHLEFGTAPLRMPAGTAPSDSARYARRRFTRDGMLDLPAERLWDLVPAVPANALRSRARWTDTLAREAAFAGLYLSVSGIRISTVIGDTLIDGVRLWIIEDSAQVHLEERRREHERTLASEVLLTRTVSGHIGGRYLYDPSMPVVHSRIDTTELVGEAVLRYPDGRSFRTPARYERVRRWTRHSPSRYASRQDYLRRERERETAGMVRVPRTELERRIASGDNPSLDSLVRLWLRTDQPDESMRLYRLLTGPGRQRERLDSLRVAAGDSALLYRRLAGAAYGGRTPTDTGTMRLMLGYMADPGRAFALGESRDVLYENLRQGLTTWPPSVTADSARWPCTRDACDMLAAQWPEAAEERLRELGLIARAVLDPRRWADTLLSRTERGSAFLDPAAMLVNGVGATWPASDKRRIPAPDADWRAWLVWMNGGSGARPAGTAPRPIRFEASHATAIRFYQARTGRDVVGELRRANTAATTDSARLVLGTILHAMDALRLTTRDLVDYFSSASPPLIQLANRALPGLMRDSSAAADSGTSVQLVDRLISMTVDGADSWTTLSGGPVLPARRLGPELHLAPTRGAVFLLGDSLPVAIHARWSSRITILTGAQWNARSVYESGVLYTLSSVRRAGPFAMLSITASERIARPVDAAPRAFAAMRRYYLMERNGEWVVVGMDGWVT